MELESDLSKIQSEELLRKMWQQSEDINRKKEIRSQLYKLRELRLRDLYQFDIMSDNRVAGFGKDPLAPSHGESLADQSFQSLKTKEIRDSMSPTEMKFQSMALNNPNTTGWNVQSSSEVSPDGRGFRAETVATTDGVENINGGTAEFKGRNEQRSTAMHEGDDKNFVKKASESSNTHLQEKVVVGDENSGRTEVRTSSSTSTSSSKVFQSSSTTDEYGQPVEYPPQYLMDSNRAPQRMQAPQYQQRPAQYEPQIPEEVRRSTDHSTTAQQQRTEQYNQNRHETNTSQNVQTDEKHEQNKRYVDVDKASPEYQQHVQYLMAQPGEIISNTVEYPKPNVKMITTVKRLPDGTIVRNKRYETEETTPSATPSHTNNTRQTVSNNTTQRRDSQTNQQSKNYQGHPPSERMRRPNDDVVDNAETTRYVHDAHRDSVSNMETKYSTTKTSNRKFSTETTSETIQESDDSHYPSSPGGSRPKPATNDFSTHGFPSVRSNKPTQEFASDRPQSARPNQGFPSQNMTSPKDALIPTRGEFEPTISERRIPTNDGEVIIVSSEKKRNVKQQTNSERIIETDIRTTDDNRYQKISDVTTTNTNQDYSTHGFPSVMEPNAQPTTFPDKWQVKPQAPTPGYPVGARPAPLNSTYAPAPHDDGVQVSTQKSHTSKHNSNVERIIETEILGEDGRPIPRAPAGAEYITNKYTVTTPGDQVPHHEFPGVSRQPVGRDHPTQGFPSERSPTKATPDYSTHGFPSARDAHKPSGTSERPQTSPIKTPASASPTSTRPNTTAIETTKRVIQKEKEVDSAHRAFAASLRSSSPVDSTRRDSYTTDGPRHTPRSSVSSTKNFRRDMREGSHDSAAGSETSRMSSTTVTRQTPPRTVGGKTVVTKQTVVTTPSPRGTKSPSPGKTVTTTTTTRTVTGKATPRDVPKSDNQHTTTTTKPDTTFPINHDSLTITKKNISDNQSHSKLSQRPVVEEPCIKKQYYLLGPSDHPITAHKPEPSPRSSPAPSSRSSPYPSKSKSPMGDDDQTVKSHTSRPLSPSYTSRSPKPIGSKDVPNSRDPHQRPTKVVSVTADERRTVDREAMLEEIDQTSSIATRRKPLRDTTAYTEDDVFITEDYLQEDVDATQNLKKKTKQLITHEKEPLPHRAPTKPTTTKTTSSPQEPHRMPTDATKRTDRTEETKRPRPGDHTSPSMKQPLAPKSNVSPRPLNGTERKIPASPRAAPAPTQSPRKPQSDPKPSSRINSDIPKNIDDKRQLIPKNRSPERIYPTESDDEPITSKPTADQRKPQPLSQPRARDAPKRMAPQTPKHFDDDMQCIGSPDPSDTEDEPITMNVRVASETVIQTTNKNERKRQKEIDELVQDDYTSRSTVQQPKNYGPRQTESKDYPVDKIPTSESPKQQPGQRKLVGYTNDQEYTSRPGPTDYPTDNELEPCEPSRYPQQHPTSCVVEPTSGSPQQHPKEPTDYPGDKQPNSKFSQQQPKNYGPGPKEPKSSDLSPTKSGQQQRENYGPGPKEPRPTVQSDDKERDLFMSTTKMYVKNNETKDITQKNMTTNIHEEFIEAERAQPELPDGAFVSKSPEEPSASSPPTYKKKGVSRRDTFEDRCRQILGMENYGDTPGAFKKRPADEDELLDEDETNVRTKTENTQKSTFEVKIEDCGDEDDEPLAINCVKQNLVVKKAPTSDDDSQNEHLPRKTTVNKETPNEALRKKPNVEESFVKTTEKMFVGDSIKELPETMSDSEPETTRPKQTAYEAVEVTKKRTPGSVSPTLGAPKETSTIEITQKRTNRSDIDDTKTTTSRSPTRSESPTFRSPKETSYETVEVTNKRTHTSDIHNTKKPTSRSPTRSESPTFRSPKETSYETVEVTNKRTHTSDIHNTKKPTSRSPTRSESPTFRSPKETSYETVEVTNKRTHTSDIHNTKKPTSRSPTRSESPTFRSPKETSYETVEVTNKRTHTSDINTKYGSPRNSFNETIEVTNKRSNINDKNKPTGKSPTRSEAPSFRTPKELSYETIEVTHKRIDKSSDVAKKTPSKSPTRSLQSSPEVPRRQQSTKTDSNKKPITKKPTDDKPSFDSPIRNQPDEEKSSVRTTEKVYVSVQQKDFSEITSDSEPETSRRKGTSYQTIDVSKKRVGKDTDITKRPISGSPTKSVAPAFETPKRKPSKPSTDLNTTKQTGRNDKVTETASIKDRLRSSVRKEKSQKKPDQVDAGSSPETSPTRYTERRRSSNISVSTEIIIEHTESETAGKKPEGTPRNPKDSTFKEIIDSTIVPDKMPRKMPVTERKESAPVHRVTRKDNDSKMSRSTSEKLIKVMKKPETTNTNLTPPSPKMSPKPSADHRRPNKCFATKTINLSTTDRLVSSEDMENVIIDIQHAKSSREPSPDKIVPTPVPAHFDTGKPRYPDVVQEPEDEPRKKPVIKNIPIFEEEQNTYVGCHITEVNLEKNRKTYDRSDYRDDEVLSTPVVEAPPSLDYPTSEKSYPSVPVPDDEYLLSVHDKVSKFQHIAEEVKKPKASCPFNREFDDITRVAEDDECLLTVDKKVEKFIKTAESLTNQPSTPTPTRDTRRPFLNETDEDLDTTECTFTSVKLAPTAPQKSPELVRHISRHISRQSDGGEPTEPIGDGAAGKHTYESREEYESKRTDQECVTHRQPSAVKQPQQQRRQPVATDDDDDYEELVPHTASHTTRLEQRRQKDILTRPSVFDNNNTTNKQPSNRVNKTQPKYVSPSPAAPKDSEKPSTNAQPRPKVKSRVQPEPLRQYTNEKPASTSTTTIITGANKRQQQSPQRRVDTDYDYHRRGSSSNVVTSVSSTTNKQTTKPYSTNGPKKSPQSLSAVTPVHKKPDRQTPLHTNKTKNSKHNDGDDDDDYVVDYTEFQVVEVVPTDSETELIINSDTARRSTTTKTTGTGTGTDKINVRKEPTTPQHTTSQTTRKMKEIPQSSTPSSSSPSTPTKNTKAHVVNLTERSTLKHNTTTTKSIDRSETNESFLDSHRPPTKTSPYPQKTNKAVTTTDSVAVRRSLFENHNSPKPTSTRVTPTSSPSSGRRPSYMDHTKSSLEHIRRDSLELNKTNYTRKPSGSYDDELHPNDRSTQVKFDVPHKQRPDLLNAVEGEDDMGIEDIFELEILERMLETVTSYELRRRIRAQIRLVKKNMMNVERNHTSEVVTTSSNTSHRERSISPESNSKIHVTTKKQYFYKEQQEEERRSSSTHTSPERTKITRTHSPEPNRKMSSPPNKPSQSRVCSKPQHGRSPSPDTKLGPKEFGLRESTKQQYVYRDDHMEQVQNVEEIYRDTSPISRRPSRKSVSPHSSPERHQVDNTKPIRVTDRSSSPREKKASPVRVYSKSPENKVSSVHKSNASYEQSVTLKQQKRVPTPQAPKTKPEQRAPVWADRKNVLKTPNTSTTSTTPRKPFSVTDSRTSSLTKTVKSNTNQSQKHTTTSNRSAYVEDDCITSSYGIGPTDENGLPLFGIRALKKKKPTSDPCETTEEVTGYVVEEKYYSDNKSKPIVERKELIYSTNPEDLNAIKEKVKETTVRSIKAHGIDEPRPKNSTYKTNQKTSTSVRSSPEEFLESSTTKYVRRGSVKEMSEKFIHKESSSTVSEKSNNYPKAGLILRTNSRKHSRDSDAMDGDNIEYYETRTHRHGADSQEDDDECLVAEGDLIMVESESETESIKKTQREFKKITSTKSSSSLPSFLNTKGEQKAVTSVDDVLDRMRNADNVVEEGDTAEDQEARALLNKFLGASIIMKGVESTIPINRETKMITTTTTGSGRQPAKHEVKTTRVTKTIKSGSSSSPVLETTCDIEEIWDEEILKQLLEQARTYEERRKIRSRLRELMADRAEKKNCQQAGKKEAAAVSDEQLNVERSDSSASEYEEIIEEVTDDSDEAEEEITTKTAVNESDPSFTKVAEENTNTQTDESSPITSAKITADNSSNNKQTSNAEEDAPPTTTTTADSISEKVTETETLKTPDDLTDSSEQDAKQQQSSTSRTEKTETKGRDGAVVTTTTKVTTRTVSGGTGPKTVSPFTKFKQLDRQNSQQSTKSPTTPSTPGGGSSASPSVTGNAPIFKFTDPALNARAATVKDQLLQWCQSKTKEYENVQITNFSACWVDGLAFCALIHHFLPDAFDYSQLTPQNRRKNFELAFTVADEKAGIAPLLDVEDMVVMKRPDWKCVFVYVQSIYRRFRNCQ